jgi:hypothetical protein
MSSRRETELRRLEASALCGVQLSWPRTNRPCPSVNEFILGVGEMMARDLGAQGETFFLEPVSNKEPDVTARGRHVALGQSCIALHFKGKYTLEAHRREYLKLVGRPPSVGEVLSKKSADHDRQLGLAPRSYQERLAEFAPRQDSYYDEPFADLEETLTMQRCMALLSSRERIAFIRMLAHQPPADNSERLARQRVRRKLRFYLESRAEWRVKHERKDAPMSATIANDLADLKLGQLMQGETLDEILRGVEALRSRDLEVIDDEEDAA